MDKKKTKRIIAREGLTIVGIAVLGSLIALLSFIFPDNASIKDILITVGLLILIYSWNVIYLSYLLIRFIIWGVKNSKFGGHTLNC